MWNRVCLSIRLEQVVALLSLPSRERSLCVCVLRRILRDSRLHVEWARGGTACFEGGGRPAPGTDGPSFILSFSFVRFRLPFSILSLSSLSLLSLIPFSRSRPFALDHVYHVNKREAGNKR